MKWKVSEKRGSNGRAKSTMALSMLTNVCVKSPRILWIIVFDDVSRSLMTLAGMQHVPQNRALSLNTTERWTRWGGRRNEKTQRMSTNLLLNSLFVSLPSVTLICTRKACSWMLNRSYKFSFYDAKESCVIYRINRNNRTWRKNT